MESNLQTVECTDVQCTIGSRPPEQIIDQDLREYIAQDLIVEVPIQNNQIVQENTFNEFDSDVVLSDDSSDDDLVNSSYESEENCNSGTDLQSDIRDIVLQGNLTQKVTNKLLRVLRKHGHIELPKDKRTLLKTPKNMSLKLQANSGGQYFHFGLQSCIKRLGTK